MSILYNYRHKYCLNILEQPLMRESPQTHSMKVRPELSKTTVQITVVKNKITVHWIHFKSEHTLRFISFQF